jgi:nickel/cobalt exporter
MEFQRILGTLDGRNCATTSCAKETTMHADLGLLYLSAITIGFLHTITGPDHYVPFVAMSQVGRWSLKKTIIVTLLCGCGHVGSSVVLGFIGVACGIVVFQLEPIESARGNLAGWLLVAFGLAYFTWGVVRAIRNVPHTHLHAHPNGTLHAHQHTHVGEHLHVHAADAVNPCHIPAADSAAANAGAGAAAMSVPSMTPWVLMVIFLFGPCEPLIPLLMYPAAQFSTWGVICVTALFGLATLATMTTVVVLMYLGAGALNFHWLHRYSHAMAGLVVTSCGLAIKLGL